MPFLVVSYSIDILTKLLLVAIQSCLSVGLTYFTTNVICGIAGL